MSNSFDSLSFQFVGHGTGAVLADLEAFYFVTENNVQNAVYLTTFGQPRPGDDVYAGNREAAVRESNWWRL